MMSDDLNAKDGVNVSEKPKKAKKQRVNLCLQRKERRLKALLRVLT